MRIITSKVKTSQGLIDKRKVVFHHDDAGPQKYVVTRQKVSELGSFDTSVVSYKEHPIVFVYAKL